jgi:hypothetical protein
MPNSFEFDDTNYMIEPLILEIYLNKADYKDRLLIGDLKKRAQAVYVPELGDSSFFVRAEEVEDILYTKYKKDISNFDSATPSDFAKSANSIFFIEAAMREFRKLRYFRIHISENEKSEKTEFSYKIMHSRVDLANSLNSEFLSKCKRIFREIGVYKSTKLEPKPYFEIQTRELLFLVQNYSLQFDKESEEYLDAIDIMLIFGQKLEKDNSTVLIVIEK